MKERLKTILAKTVGFLDRVSSVNLDNPKTWKRTIIVCIPVSVLSLLIAWLTTEHPALNGFSLFTGLGAVFTGWIAYCALEGIKREQQMVSEQSTDCPYKLENPRG